MQFSGEIVAKELALTHLGSAFQSRSPVKIMTKRIEATKDRLDVFHTVPVDLAHGMSVVTASHKLRCY